MSETTLKGIWMETDAASGGFERNDIVIKIHIPTNVYVAFDRKALGRRLYELMCGESMELEAAPVRVDIPEPEMPGLPPTWHVWYCNKCGYSVTFDEEVMESYGTYDEWIRVVDKALNHHH